MKIASIAMVLAGFMFASAHVIGDASPEDLDRLGKDLTPLGAEKAGNADGSIPEWTGGGIENIPPSYVVGGHHPDPFADDPVLFTITAENADQYADKLIEGQMALFKTYPDTFKMHVYPTRRTFKGPEWLYENTKECATRAYMTNDGNAINDVHACIPFPIPENGHEVMWNHLLHYRGLYREEDFDAAAPDARGRFVTDRVARHTYWPYYDPGKPDTDIFSMFIPHQYGPPRRAGDTFLIIDYLNPIEKPRAAWRYFVGQRRVRRAPVFAFDTPVPPSQGLRTVDSFEMFVGSLQKFSWELIGKREIYVGYNCYALGGAGVSIKKVAWPGHIDPDLIRYELHRVWVIDGRLRDGERHVYGRRVIYLDEDSWGGVAADMYDVRGQLWRTAYRYLKFFWEAEVMSDASTVHHDLISRRYNLVVITGEYDKPYDYSKPPPPDTFWTPANVRRMGTR